MIEIPICPVGRLHELVSRSYRCCKLTVRGIEGGDFSTLDRRLRAFHPAVRVSRAIRLQRLEDGCRQSFVRRDGGPMRLFALLLLPAALRSEERRAGKEARAR